MRRRSPKADILMRPENWARNFHKVIMRNFIIFETLDLYISIITLIDLYSLLNVLLNRNYSGIFLSFLIEFLKKNNNKNKRNINKTVNLKIATGQCAVNFRINFRLPDTTAQYGIVR